LVAAGGGAKQVAAALRYLFATLLGSGAYLLGVALIYGTYGTVSISSLTPLLTADAPNLVKIAGALMLLGLMLKTALFPFLAAARPRWCPGAGLGLALGPCRQSLVLLDSAPLARAICAAC
jgi:formate hydrogenlyase subunit 3/multisubunit Na+/H+ antiporter MnhD subunit